jgi:two-component system OmpR family response regulator
MSKAPFSALLLDDDPHTRELFRLVFTHHELELVTVGTADAALECLRNYTPQVVVVDLVLPDIDGFAALAQIRKLPTSSQMRFVATTAYYTSDTTKTVFAHGFDGYLPKPFDVEELVSQLRSVIQN